LDNFIQASFRFLLYVCFGFSMEVFYAVTGIERAVSRPIPTRVPRKYLEGFVSLYMIPIHGFGMLFGFEGIFNLIRNWHIAFRFLAWALLFTLVEALAGFIYDKLLGFYPWDYYELSPYKIFNRGYTLWTQLPQWGLVGLMLEVFSDLLVYLSPHVGSFFHSYF